MTTDSGPATATQAVVDSVSSSTTAFAALGLVPELVQSVERLGYEEPTPIQRQAIPALLEGADVMAQAQSGSGKTAAFALPAVQMLDSADRHVQVLVLAPTRELAVQVAEVTHRFGRARGVDVVAVYGGQPIDRQLRALRSGVQIVVGTPGRLLDHLRRGSLSLDAVRLVVLDEADEMLDMGFIEDIEDILKRTPAGRQTALFSATIPAHIRRLASQYMREPRQISVAPGRLTVPKIDQRYVDVTPRNKLDALTRVIDVESPTAAMVFCRTRREVDDLGEALISRGYAAEAIHGDLSQSQRDRVMSRFRTGQADILVATDVAARGLDIENVSHVFNYDIPESPDGYVHRIGRTGRAGRSGTAITLVTPREQRQLHLIERVVGRKIKAMRLPTPADVAARRVEVLRDGVRSVLERGGLEQYLAAVEDLADDFDLAEIAAAAMKLSADRDGGRPSQPPESDGVPAEQGMARLFVEIGRKQGVRPGDLVGAIANEARVPGSSVGSIDIYDQFTFVEVEQSMAQRIIEALNRSTIRGQRIKADVARPR
jgi:ATP-dependent RNA helicase DeaD